MTHRVFAYLLAITISLLPAALFAAHSEIIPDQFNEHAHRMIVGTLADARDAAIQGPKKIKISDQAVLDLPKDYVYVPAAAASAYMSVIGNKTQAGFSGLIMPKLDNNWFIAINVDKSGYINTLTPNPLSADSLFAGIQKNIAAENKENIKKELPTYSMVDWSIKPAFNSEKKILTFGLIAQNPSDQDKTVNDVAVLFGRDGVVRLNLVTVQAAYSEDKTHLPTMINAIHFNPGKTYTDFTANQDAVASYDMTTFITGLLPDHQPNPVTKYWWTILFIPLLWLGLKKLAKKGN